jgi:hypothetical protein
MIIRIRFGKGAKVGKGVRKNTRQASVAAALLNPAAAITAALALWRVTADMNITRSFAIPSGFFSHWQVWLAAAVILQVCSRVLNRYSHSEEEASPADREPTTNEPMPQGRG